MVSNWSPNLIRFSLNPYMKSELAEHNPYPSALVKKMYADTEFVTPEEYSLTHLILWSL